MLSSGLYRKIIMSKYTYTVDNTNNISNGTGDNEFYYDSQWTFGVNYPSTIEKFLTALGITIVDELGLKDNCTYCKEDKNIAILYQPKTVERKYCLDCVKKLACKFFGIEDEVKVEELLYGNEDQYDEIK